MSRSAEEGRWFVKASVERMGSGTVLDVGPGAGTYWDLLGESPGMVLDAVEIFEPYIVRFDLATKYREVTLCDIRAYDWPTIYDYVILGDVLEHMVKDDALLVWEQSRAHARKAVILSCPVFGYEQGTLEGNPAEAHLYQWSADEVLRDLGGITDHWVGTIIGVFIAKGLAS